MSLVTGDFGPRRPSYYHLPAPKSAKERNVNETGLIQEAAIFDINLLPEGYISTVYEGSDVQYIEQPANNFFRDREGGEWLFRVGLGLPRGVVIAGGYAADLVTHRSTTKDIDLFFTPGPGNVPADQVFEETVHALVLAYGYRPAPEHAHHFDAARTLVRSDALNRAPFITLLPSPEQTGWLPVQCIKIHWYKDAEEVLDGFDFTCIQFAIELDSGGPRLVQGTTAGIDLAAKRLVQHRIEGRVSTTSRYKRYHEKGFRAAGDRLRAAGESDVLLSEVLAA